MPEKIFRIYNSMTRSTEAVEPAQPGRLRFYACGPTVYSYAHIGNFRSFLTADLVLRTAQALGWETAYVTNITDVGHLTEDDVADAEGEDRMTKALQSREGERFANIWDLARYYANVLLSDWRALNLREPDVRPRATDHVAQQIRDIARLLEKGHAYETAQGVYFSVNSFPDYGKLSGNVLANALDEGVRDVVQDPEKRDPRDFALWKKDPHHLMVWHSPWGWGFPGWHIECSTMAQAYLGESFDLHTGGEDNKFPHHECEIAQAECLSGKPFARYWLHTRFLQVEGEKMAKSAGNFLTVRELVGPESEGGRGVDPLTLRLALISGQYRNPLNFTFDQLRACARHTQRFKEAAALAEQGLARNDPGEDLLGEPLARLYEQALDAMLDDLNTPKAIAASLEGAKLILRDGTRIGGAAGRSATDWLTKINDLLGIVRQETQQAAQQTTSLEPAQGARSDTAENAFTQEVEELLRQRAEARAQRDFQQADALRDQLAGMQVEIMDGPEGTRWRRKITSPVS